MNRQKNECGMKNDFFLKREGIDGRDWRFAEWQQ